MGKEEADLRRGRGGSGGGLEDCHAKFRLVINQLLHRQCQSPGAHNNPFVAVTLEEPMLKNVTVTKCGTIKGPEIPPQGPAFWLLIVGKHQLGTSYLLSQASWLVALHCASPSPGPKCRAEARYPGWNCWNSMGILQRHRKLVTKKARSLQRGLVYSRASLGKAKGPEPPWGCL